MKDKTNKCIIDLGPGDGRKTAIPVEYAITSNRYGNVTVGLVDCSRDMLKTAGDYLEAFIRDKLKKEPDVVRIHERFENLRTSPEYRGFLNEHMGDVREFLFYGSTAGNFDPPIILGILYDSMLPKDHAQVGLHLYTEGHDDDILKKYQGLDARDVSFVGLKELGFTEKDKGAMEYYAEITKREYEEFKEFDLGPLTAVKTFFRAKEPMERGLITLKGGDSLQAVLSIKYREDQSRRVFEYGGKFNILEIYKDGDIAIIWMRKN
ncbi:MAG: hypothetical protein NT129_05940 [Candidatus Aenigmarchaeota archaeon]|nr:hypothetical protein [Candidatus Aenigmarchaeota archaeon]